jgi:hypothetical protein
LFFFDLFIECDSGYVFHMSTSNRYG